MLKQKLDDPSWRNKLRETIERARAMSYLMGVRGQHYDLARALFELRKLVIALERWERM